MYIKCQVIDQSGNVKIEGSFKEEVFEQIKFVCEKYGLVIILLNGDNKSR